MLNKFKDVYDNRWKASAGTEDDDILALEKPKRQVEFFYYQYNTLISEIISEAIGGNGKKMLEIGCGRATSSIFQALKIGIEVYPTDYSEYALEVARKNLEKYAVDATLSQEDLYEMSYPDENFDAIISLGVMEHIEFVDKAYEEMYRLLKKGGIMISMNVPEHPKNIQRIAAPMNNLLVKIENFFQRRESKPWLDKTRSKTSDVYRSELYGDEFAKIVAKAGFSEVNFIELNPFPTIDPLPKFLDYFVVIFYKLVLVIRKQVLGKKNPFFCSARNSRAHFVVARKT